MRRHALFVGVNNYTDKDIHPLRFAVNDATEMAGFFKHCANFDRAEALTDPRNCDAVLDHIRDMVDGLGPGDEFLFFFAGHGVTTPDGHRLVCAGDDLVSVKHSWAGVPLERLKLETNKSFDRLFLLDACRTDVLATHRGVAGAMAKGTRDLILDGGGSLDVRSGALTILCSCDDGECAGENKRLRHGLFSKAILELLNEKHNCGGKLFVDDDFVYKHLPARMHILAEKSGMDSKQNPQKNGPPILVLDGVASRIERSHGDESSRVEEQQRLAAITGKDKQYDKESKHIQEGHTRHEEKQELMDCEGKTEGLQKGDVPNGGGIFNNRRALVFLSVGLVFTWCVCCGGWWLWNADRKHSERSGSKMRRYDLGWPIWLDDEGDEYPAPKAPTKPKVVAPIPTVKAKGVEDNPVELKREAECILAPTLCFVAKIGDREVPATASFVSEELITSHSLPWHVENVKFSSCIPNSEGMVEYAEGDKRYVGTITPVTVDWNGPKTVTVELMEYKGPKLGDIKTITLPGGEKMELVWCPSGGFMMGGSELEGRRTGSEEWHYVMLTNGFWMGKYEVTQAQWKGVMGKNPAHFKSANHPVENVSWNDCQEFIHKINSAGQVTVSLPTEAQWEYACRAGTTTPFNFGWSLNGDKANCDGNVPCGTTAKGRYRRETAPVGSYEANAWGFYDMHGNVREWCADWFGSYVVIGADGTSSRRVGRVFRGGCWYDGAHICCSAFRSGREPGDRDVGIGLRLVCSAALSTRRIVKTLTGAEEEMLLKKTKQYILENRR